jgi:hypothetical protein
MAHNDNIVRFRRTPVARHGLCHACVWSCGALSDSCDNPAVMVKTGRPIVKALVARREESICGAGAKHWLPNPNYEGVPK